MLLHGLLLSRSSLAFGSHSDLGWVCGLGAYGVGLGVIFVHVELGWARGLGACGVGLGVLVVHVELG